MPLSRAARPFGAHSSGAGGFPAQSEGAAGRWRARIGHSLGSSVGRGSHEKPGGSEQHERGGPPCRAGRGSERMKLIMAIVKPFKLDDVREALVAAGVE